MNTKSTVSVLKSSPLFKDMPEDVLHDMSKEFKEFSYQKHDIIDYALTDKYFFILASGSFEMTRMDIQSGKVIALFLYECGDVFDLLPMLDGKEHDVELLAAEKSVVLRVPIKQMRQWITVYPELNKAFFSYLADKMKELEDFSEQMAFCDTKTRLAQLILRHVDDSCSLDDKPIPVKLISNLTHESLAQLIGSVRSVVTTELNQLKKEGILIKHKGSLAIKDLKRLKKKCRSLK